VLKEYLDNANTSSQYAALWLANFIHDPSFELEYRTQNQSFMPPPIDEPTEEELLRFADELSGLINDKLNKTWTKETFITDESGNEQLVPMPLNLLIEVVQSVPCAMLEDAAEAAQMHVPWWGWPSSMRIRVSRFHAEVQRHEISPWYTIWGERPNSIPPGEKTDPIKYVRGKFG
jgi:hypothetical protein